MGQSVKKQTAFDEKTATLKLLKDKTKTITSSAVDPGITANLAVIAVYKPLFGNDYSYAYCEHL